MSPMNFISEICFLSLQWPQEGLEWNLGPTQVLELMVYALLPLDHSYLYFPFLSFFFLPYVFNYISFCWLLDVCQQKQTWYDKLLSLKWLFTENDFPTHISDFLFHTFFKKVSNTLHYRDICQEQLKIHFVLLYLCQKNEFCSVSIWPLKCYALTGSLSFTCQTVLEIRGEKHLVNHSGCNYIIE